MKVLFDTNVVLDHLLAREPFVDPAERLLSLVDSGALEGVVCSTTLTTIHYLAAKAPTQRHQPATTASTAARAF